MNQFYFLRFVDLSSPEKYLYAIHPPAATPAIAVPPKTKTGRTLEAARKMVRREIFCWI